MHTISTNTENPAWLSGDTLSQVCSLVQLLPLSTPKLQNCDFLRKQNKKNNKEWLHNLIWEKKLPYGYQGQKYGFQDKTYGCPYGKKGLLSRNSAVAFFMPIWMVRVFPSAEQGYLQADYIVINSHANFTKCSTGIIFIRFFLFS